MQRCTPCCRHCQEHTHAVYHNMLQALSRAHMLMLEEHCQKTSSQLHPQLYRQLAAPAGEACDAGGDWRATLRYGGGGPEGCAGASGAGARVAASPPTAAAGVDTSTRGLLDSGCGCCCSACWGPGI